MGVLLYLSLDRDTFACPCVDDGPNRTKQRWLNLGASLSEATHNGCKERQHAMAAREVTRRIASNRGWSTVLYLRSKE